MPRIARALAAALLVSGLGLLTACGDGDADAAAAVRSGTPQTVDCPGKATPVQLPQGFAAPLPAGTIVVAVQKRDDGTTVVTGVLPVAEAAALKDLQHAYASGGWKLTEGETEARDAESNFTGNGITGRWGIRELSDCTPTATRIDLVTRAA